MARKIRDGAMFIYLNAILMLLCRQFFSVNEYLETRILFVAAAATILWYGGQVFLNDEENDKEKKLEREEKKIRRFVMDSKTTAMKMMDENSAERKEAEKMMSCKFEDMTVEQRQLAAVCVSAFQELNKK